MNNFVTFRTNNTNYLHLKKILHANGDASLFFFARYNLSRSSGHLIARLFEHRPGPKCISSSERARYRPYAHAYLTLARAICS